MGTTTNHSNDCLDGFRANSITIALSFFSQLTHKNAAEVLDMEDDTISDLVPMFVVTPLITHSCMS